MNRNEDPEERLNRLEALLARQIRIFGPDGGPAANARELVATQLEKMDRFTEARLLREEVVAAFRRNRGEEDEYTLLAEEWLGTNLAKSGKPREARLLYGHVYEIRLRTAGPEDKGTLRTQQILRGLDPGDEGSNSSNATGF